VILERDALVDLWRLLISRHWGSRADNLYRGRPTVLAHVNWALAFDAAAIFVGMYFIVFRRQAALRSHRIEQKLGLDRGSPESLEPICLLVGISMCSFAVLMLGSDLR
jgi:hypothetical protein